MWTSASAARAASCSQLGVSPSTAVEKLATGTPPVTLPPHLPRPAGKVRWVEPELVVEVEYDHFTAGRFRHGTHLVRWRPDKAPRQCTMEQLGEEARPAIVEAALKEVKA